MTLARSHSQRGSLSLRAALMIAGAAALVVLVFRGAVRKEPAATPKESFPTRLTPEEISPNEAQREASPISSSLRRDVERPRAVQDVTAEATAQPVADPAPGTPASRRRDDKKTLPEIFRMRIEDPEAANPAAVPKRPDEAPRRAVVPFGRLVKCQLVETLDSVTARSAPIVALVTEDLCWDGEVVIPAGSEVLGYAKPEPVLDQDGRGRLIDSGEWTVVLRGGAGTQEGRELALRARALDRSDRLVGNSGKGASWGPSDGADGLQGETISTQGDREAKLMAAAALSGIAQGAVAVAERQQPASGLPGVLGAKELAPTLGNAVASSVGSGATELLGQMAGRIRDEIARRGAYVRVPAGKTFYLFVEQSIDPGEAALGLRLPKNTRTSG